MPKIKVLLADDHPIFRDGARAILEKEADIELVGEATNGQEAIEQSTELLPDVIVMDIGMPKVNGLQAATTNKEIAEKLFASVKTVETHRTHIYKKLDIHDRTELVKLALDKGLLDKD